jgi:hypothetical protein
MDGLCGGVDGGFERVAFGDRLTVYGAARLAIAYWHGGFGAVRYL